MRTRKRIVAGVICGVLAALFMMVYISDVRAQALDARQEAIERYGGEVVDTCVAVCDIASGEVISSSDIESRAWPVDLLPDGAIVDASDAIGETARVPLLANEPLSAAKIGDSLSSVSVPDGLCAVSVPAQDVLAVGGAIKSGSLVNVYAAGSSVRLLGEGILVLETSNSGAYEQGETVFGNASGRSSLSWVTLAVTPESVEELIAVSKNEGLYFALPGTATSGEALPDGDAPDDSGDDAGAGSPEEGEL